MDGDKILSALQETLQVTRASFVLQVGAAFDSGVSAPLTHVVALLGDIGKTLTQEDVFREVVSLLSEEETKAFAAASQGPPSFGKLLDALLLSSAKMAEKQAARALESSANSIQPHLASLVRSSLPDLLDCSVASVLPPPETSKPAATISQASVQGINFPSLSADGSGDAADPRRLQAAAGLGMVSAAAPYGSTLQALPSGSSAIASSSSGGGGYMMLPQQQPNSMIAAAMQPLQQPSQAQPHFSHMAAAAMAMQPQLPPVSLGGGGGMPLAMPPPLPTMHAPPSYSSSSRDRSRSRSPKRSRFGEPAPMYPPPSAAAAPPQPSYGGMMGVPHPQQPPLMAPPLLSSSSSSSSAMVAGGPPYGAGGGGAYAAGQVPLLPPPQPAAVSAPPPPPVPVLLPPPYHPRDLVAAALSGSSRWAVHVLELAESRDMALLPSEPLDLYKDALTLLLFARVAVFMGWCHAHESKESIKQRKGMYWSLPVPQPPTNPGDARRTFLEFIGKDSMLCTLIWLSLLADCEASAELRPDIAGMTPAEREAERVQHRSSVFNPSLYALPRKARFGDFVASESLCQFWFATSYMDLAREQVAVVVDYEKGVKAGGPRVQASPLEAQLTRLEKPSGGWSSAPPLQPLKDLQARIKAFIKECL